MFLVLGSFILVPTFLVYFHDILNLLVFLVTFVIVAITVIVGVYVEVHREISERQKVLDDLYSRCHTEMHKKHMKFFIDYFGI